MARRFLPVPYFSQPIDKPHCGIVSLRMVLGYHGTTVSHKELCRSFDIGENGIHPPQISQVAREFGYRAQTVNKLSIDDLIRFVNDRIPIIIRTRYPSSEVIDDPEVRHFTVVRGYDTAVGNIYTHDPYPGKGMNVLPYGLLKKIWSILNSTDGDENSVNQGIIIRPR